MIIKNKYFPFKGFTAINLFGHIFVRRDYRVSRVLLNHERIHTAQMREMLYLFFYLWYFIEWVIRLFLPGNAYMNISFEREAYRHETHYDYLKERKPFAFLHYIKKRY